VDNWISGVAIELGAAGATEAPASWRAQADHGALHPQRSSPGNGTLLLRAPADRLILPSTPRFARSALAPPTAVQCRWSSGFCPWISSCSAADPVQVEGGIPIDAGVTQGLDTERLGVVELLDVLAHNATSPPGPGLAQLAHQISQPPWSLSRSFEVEAHGSTSRHRPFFLEGGSGRP